MLGQLHHGSVEGPEGLLTPSGQRSLAAQSFPFHCRRCLGRRKRPHDWWTGRQCRRRVDPPWLPPRQRRAFRHPACDSGEAHLCLLRHSLLVGKERIELSQSRRLVYSEGGSPPARLTHVSLGRTARQFVLAEEGSSFHDLRRLRCSRSSDVRVIAPLVRLHKRTPYSERICVEERTAQLMIVGSRSPTMLVGEPRPAGPRSSPADSTPVASRCCLGFEAYLRTAMQHPKVC